MTRDIQLVLSSLSAMSGASMAMKSSGKVKARTKLLARCANFLDKQNLK